ncbi:hypothetical protein [Clostridium akagii]|uniref:hypothetical protein n=1 Tax=Clostridium akagii TaxID=91623 RepID=UPI00047B3F82|nr:hypothetical protein [Clostridium akagii]
MKKFKTIKIASFIGLVIILSGFIIGFFIFSNLYSYGNKNSITTTLDRSLFNVKTSNNEENHIVVDKITKLIIPYIFIDYDFLDINTIAFTSLDKNDNTSYVKTSIYDIRKKLLTYKSNDENPTNGSKIHISMDGKMILTSYKNNNIKLNKTSIYDVSAKKLLKTFGGVATSAWLPDNSGFVGIDNYLFVQNIRTNERKNLFKLPEDVKLLFKENLILKISEDGERACLSYNNNVIMVDIRTGKLIKLIMPGPIIALNDKNIVIACSAINNDYGLYLYDIKNKSYKKISVYNKFFNVDISPSGKKIVYGALTNDGKTEIHVAYLNNDKIINDVVIYKDLKDIINLRWSRDSQMLYFVTQNVSTIEMQKEKQEGNNIRGNTLIYRISFKSS